MMDVSDDEVEEETNWLDNLPKVLLLSIISFGTITDHTKLKATSKYLHSLIVSYYTQKSTYIHDISLPITDDLIAWLTNHIINIKKLKIHNNISISHLKTLLKNKKYIDYIDISPIKPHNEIPLDLANIIKNSDYCPNLKHIKMIQSYAKIENNEDLEEAKLTLETAKNENNICVERIPSQYVGYWIVHHSTSDWPIGVVHNYPANGLFTEIGHRSRSGIILGTQYVESDPTKSTFIFSVAPWTWNFSSWGIPDLQVMVRPWKIPQDILDNVYKDEKIMNALKSINDNYYEMDDILSCKHHWEGIEALQTNDMNTDNPKEWLITDDYENYEYCYWIRFVLDE